MSVQQHNTSLLFTHELYILHIVCNGDTIKNLPFRFNTAIEVKNVTTTSYKSVTLAG